jgi:hypothetical protein
MSRRVLIPDLRPCAIVVMVKSPPDDRSHTGKSSLPAALQPRPQSDRERLRQLTVAYPWLPLTRPLYLCAVALCLPGVVMLGGLNPLDKVLGDLS